MSKKTAIIIGGGPAGLTAASEFLDKTDIQPVILEADSQVGGLSKTILHNGNRLDLGPHRFFSKSERVMDWWQRVLPIEANEDVTIRYHRRETTVHPAQHEKSDNVMLVIDRLTRIYFLGKLFDYPIRPDRKTLAQLGFWRVLRIGASYTRSRLFPRNKETTLEDFFVNRFGNELYKTFFRDYTEKVWGVSPAHLDAAWGAQRVKGLSLGKAIRHFFRPGKKKSLRQEKTETSLIERFLYPKKGTGQMWEEVAKNVKSKGGEIRTNETVNRIITNGKRVEAVETIDSSGAVHSYSGDYFLSSMPVQDFVRMLSPAAPENVVQVASGLRYRASVIVGLLATDIQLKSANGEIVRDNWIYIQEKKVGIGRIQIYNNWGGSMVKDPQTVWLGVEYFCEENDELWNTPDSDIAETAVREMEFLRILRKESVKDSIVVRVPKTYPSYAGDYQSFAAVQSHLDQFENLFLVGRNGMHKYNNQDHSMLTAMQAVDNIAKGVTDKSNIWSINTEEEYHEE